MKNSKKVVAMLSLLLLTGGMMGPVQAHHESGKINLDTQSRQIDPGGSCTQHTTGGGCFTSSIVANTIMAAHSNPTHTHNVTAVNANAQSQSLWRSASFSGAARANLNTTRVGNLSFWNIR